MGDVSGRNPAVYQNLVDAGCDAGLVERFFALAAPGKENAQLDLLAAHRRILLENIHRSQKCLDCLDYLLYQIRKDRAK